MAKLLSAPSKAVSLFHCHIKGHGVHWVLTDALFYLPAALLLVNRKQPDPWVSESITLAFLSSFAERDARFVAVPEMIGF